MADHPSVQVRSFRRQAAVVLAAEEMEVTFLPELGMLGASVSVDGQEFLDLHGGPEAVLDGHTTGLPLLHPWANRLSGRRYRAAGVDVDLQGLDLHTDGNGLPIHGTMAARPEWEVADVHSGRAATTLWCRYRFGEQEDLLASFPFPHDLTLEITVDGALSVSTTITPTGDRAVPVSFGWHPYLRLPRARRAVRLGLPARQHVELDDLGLPTGASTLERSESAPLGNRTFDDHYVLGSDRRLWIEGGGHRLTMVLDAGYPYAQVYAPAGKSFVALEPMTALIDALGTDDCPLVSPGDSFTARFTLSVESSD